MATMSRNKLSGSTDGKAIDIAATSIGSGTTIHTAVSGTTDWDMVTLYAINTDTVDRDLVVGWGGTSDPDIFTVTIPTKTGLYLIVPSLPLQNGAVVRGACATANVIQVYGYIDFIDN